MTKTKQLMPRLLFMIVLPLLLVLFKPTVVHAHDNYFLQMLFDPVNMTYQSSVQKDSLSWWTEQTNVRSEKHHTEQKLGSYDALLENAALDVSLYGDADTNKSKASDYLATSDYYPYMIFSFPSVQSNRKAGGLVIGRNDANHLDAARAYAISDTLTPNLNHVLSIINKANPTYDDIKAATAAILKASGAGNKNGTTTVYNNWTLTPTGNSLRVAHSSGDSYTVLSRMVKGYTSDKLEDGSSSPIYDSDFDASQDAKYISIGMLGAQALHLYEIHSYSLSNVPNVSNQSVITQKFNEFLFEVLNSIRNVLGLKSMEQMIFGHNNPGTFGGVMPMNWFRVATTFHLIFQAIAWSLITIAIVKILIQNNLATINVYSRISMIESIKKLLMTAGLLGTSFLIINVLVRLNSQMVSIFSSMAGDKPIGSSLSNSTAIGGTILNFYYLGITIYFNFIYIMRALTVAVLMASAPLFIVTIAFSSSESKMFSIWGKELVSNVFLQSFHAFVFSLVFSLSVSSTGIEFAVVAFSLVPLSSFFRNLITGGETLSSKLGQNTAGGIVQAGAGLASGAMLMSRMGGKGKGGFGGGGDSSDGMNNEKGIADTTNTFDNLDSTKGTVDSMNKTTKDSGQDSNPNNMVSNDYNAHSGTGAVSKFDRAKNIGMATAKTIGGAGVGLAGVGLAIGMATTGANPKVAALVGAGALGKGFGMSMAGAKSMNGEMGGMMGEYASSKSDPSAGNIIHAETLENGDTEIHRDKAQVMEQEGVVNAYQTSEDNQAITYDMDKIKQGSEADINVGFAMDNFNEKTGTYFNRRGIENVTRDGQNPNLVTVHYNSEGSKEMGFNKMNATERRIKEVKTPSNSKTTNFNYHPNNMNVPPIRDEESDHKFIHRGGEVFDKDDSTALVPGGK